MKSSEEENIDLMEILDELDKGILSLIQTRSRLVKLVRNGDAP